MSDYPCDCGFEAKSGAGLAAHRRACSEGSSPASVLDAVKRDLEGCDGPESLRASALMLAETMDRTSSPRYLPALSKELREVLDGLLTEVEEQRSGLDELSRKRAARGSAS